MKIHAENNEIILTDIFNGIGLRNGKNTIGVSARDGWFEIKHQDKLYRVDENGINPLSDGLEKQLKESFLRMNDFFDISELVNIDADTLNKLFDKAKPKLHNDRDIATVMMLEPIIARPLIFGLKNSDAVNKFFENDGKLDKELQERFNVSIEELDKAINDFLETNVPDEELPQEYKDKLNDAIDEHIEQQKYSYWLVFDMNDNQVSQKTFADKKEMKRFIHFTQCNVMFAYRLNNKTKEVKIYKLKKLLK